MINPLTPESDQHPISPYNINPESHRDDDVGDIVWRN